MKPDHLVYSTHQIPKAVATAQQALGIHVVEGGRHLPWGTQNALLYTSNAYIEFLSIDNKEVAFQSDFPLTKLLLYDLKKGEGWSTICISVTDMESFKNSLLLKGFKTSEIIPGQRKTPDGELLEWKLLFVDKSDLSQLPFPFFIEWNQPESVRRKRLKEKGTILPFNEKLSVKECIFSTENPEKETKLWSRLLDLEIHHPSQIILDDVLFKFVSNPHPTDSRLQKVIIK